ncbi:CD48 antigen-like [Alca torda]
MEHVTLLLLISLFFLCRAHGSPECREQAVSAGGELRLLPEKAPQGWKKLHWKMRADTGVQHRILTADRNKDVQLSDSPFSGRAFFQRESLSLWIRWVGTADSGVYRAEFEDAAGALTSLCFRVRVWEPVPPPRLETRVLQREQDRCNLSLLCTVPGADADVSYSWSCSGDPLGALERQPQLHLQVLGDTSVTVCRCNASNPVSWASAGAELAAACRHAAGPGVSWSYCGVKGTLSLLALGGLGAAVAITHLLVRQRGAPPRGAPSNSGAR